MAARFRIEFGPIRGSVCSVFTIGAALAGGACIRDEGSSFTVALDMVSGVSGDKGIKFGSRGFLGVSTNAPGGRLRGWSCDSNSSEDSPCTDSLGDGVTGDAGANGFGVNRDRSGRVGSEKFRGRLYLTRVKIS
jgi:hypothetical protein